MALKDVFRRHSEPTTPAPPEREGEPGSASSPVDVGGRGPVTLEDRTAHGGQGSPDTNQAKAEPLPATASEPDPTAPVEPPGLEQMNVGGADPQSPSHPLSRARDVAEATPEGAPAGAGAAQRAPGSLGVSPEQQETDVAAGAGEMQVGGGPSSVPAAVQPGDAQDVSVPHEVPMPGTSEESPVAQGARTPQD